MKKYMLIPIALFSAVLFLNFNNSDGIRSETTTPSSEFSIPAEIQEVLDNSCYGCHNSESKNTKGKTKIKFDKLGDLKTHKLVGKLGNVSEAIGKEKMPPKKFLQKYPESTLTDEQKELLINWAESTAKSYSE